MPEANLPALLFLNNGLITAFIPLICKYLAGFNLIAGASAASLKPEQTAFFNQIRQMTGRRGFTYFRDFLILAGAYPLFETLLATV